MAKVTEKVVHLELTDLETKLVRDIMGRIGGCPDTSLRKITDNIAKTLEQSGYHDLDTNHLYTKNYPSIDFKDDTLDKL